MSNKANSSPSGTVHEETTPFDVDEYLPNCSALQATEIARAATEMLDFQDAELQRERDAANEDENKNASVRAWLDEVASVRDAQSDEKPPPALERRILTVLRHAMVTPAGELPSAWKDAILEDAIPFLTQLEDKGYMVQDYKDAINESLRSREAGQDQVQ